MLRKVSSGDLVSREDDILLSQPLETELSLRSTIHVNSECTKLDMRLDLPLPVPKVLRGVTKAVLTLLFLDGRSPSAGATNAAAASRELNISHITCRLFSRPMTPARMSP